MTAIRMIEYHLIGKPVNGTAGAVASEVPVTVQRIVCRTLQDVPGHHCERNQKVRGVRMIEKFTG